MEEFVGTISEKVRSAAERAGALVIKSIDSLCDNDVCPIVGKDGHLMYFNYGHLRRTYVRDHTTYFDQIFIPALGH